MLRKPKPPHATRNDKLSPIQNKHCGLRRHRNIVYKSLNYILFHFLALSFE